LGFTHVLVLAGHTVLVLVLHDPLTQGAPGMVTGEHVPQWDVAERAQKVLMHCASSPHAAPLASVPAAARQLVPLKSPSRNLSHERLGSSPAQVLVLIAEALVPGRLKFGTHPSAQRCLQVAASP
jgi:hypothetical protein